MGGCAAPNCSNQSKNNLRMFRFPRNEERRRKWIVNFRRDQWILGPGVYLCEVHFEENQFECSRQDGRKKLRSVLCQLFSMCLIPPQLLTPQCLKGIGLPKHHSVTSKFCNGGLLHSLPYSTEVISVAEPSVVHLQQPSASYFGGINFAAKVSDVCLQEQASTSSCGKMPCICEGSRVCLQEQPVASFCNEIPSICEGCDDVLLRNIIKQQTELISLLQCQNKILLKELTATKKKNEINVLKKWHSTEIQLHDLQVQHEKLLKGVKTFLSDEQIAMLKIPRRSIVKWSNEGIIKGLKVRFALGKHGYNYFHRIGFPVLSYSTLNKRLSRSRNEFWSHQ